MTERHTKRRPRRRMPKAVETALWPLSYTIMVAMGLGRIVAQHAREIGLRACCALLALLFSAVVLTGFVTHDGSVSAVDQEQLTFSRYEDIMEPVATFYDMENRTADDHINYIVFQDQEPVPEPTHKLTPEPTPEPAKGLVATDEPDPDYRHPAIRLTDEDRDLLQRLVMGEAGNQGYEGAALVAQAVRDAMVYDGYSSVAKVRSGLKYSAEIDHKPNQNVIDAVSYIFDQGGIAVQHRILYFYSGYPEVTAKWHETQHLIVHYKDHRFFDRW